MPDAQEGAMEARVLKHYLLLHDAAAEGEDGADRSGAAPVPGPIFGG